MSCEPDMKSNYKACAVDVTIMNLRRLLHDAGLFIFENQWWNNEGKRATSILVTLDGNVKVRTSGKGINRQYALASGLAEMLERLQNLQFTQHVNSCKVNTSYCYSDSKQVNFEDIDTLNYFSPKFDNYLRVISAGKKKISIVPFYNVCRDRIEYFPYDLLWCCNGSNGMCAGNTPSEAMIQGICEIMERYVLHKLYFDKLVLPTIPDEHLCTTRNWHYVSALRECGFSVEVKDCTLGGKLPVVGILVSKDGRATFCAGSAPDFDIALERCFTENMQGRNIQTLHELMPEIKCIDTEHELIQQYRLSLTKHTGIVPENLFYDGGVADIENLKWASNPISKDTLKELISVIRSMGYDIFIRDVSFLGFPSYHIYVPGMSDIMPDYDDTLFLEKLDTDLKDVFFNSDSATGEELSNLIDAIEKKLIHARKYKIPFNMLELFGLSYRDETHLNSISPNIFLAISWCKVGNYDKALSWIDEYIENNSQIDNDGTASLNCLRETMVSLKRGTPLSRIKDILESKYASDLIDETCTLVGREHPLSKAFGIPHPDNCEHCSVCYYKELNDLASKLTQQMNDYHFDQSQLRQYVM